ncbi:response regulator [uncultured Thiodictyon sp.]|uniref:response regulator transcription factor n=1 Tax=uncultured Thiodictyon sp. TaxID=1846217 RepID=UPI0025FF1429|nr:response regulator [uncultured Thiodictyon sp.]
MNDPSARDHGPVVHVVDDDASFLVAVGRLLRAAGCTVRTFASAAELLAQLGDTAGCVIADLRMPVMDGLDLQQALLRQANALPVIFLTGEGDIPTSVRAMRHGAEDFLTKQAPQEDLLAAVDRAIARDARQRAEGARLRALRARLSTLSLREHEVLQHVVRGRLNKQIAADLGIGERTVKLHRTAITTKLQLRSVAELTRLVQELGVLVEHPPTCPKGQ